MPKLVMKSVVKPPSKEVNSNSAWDMAEGYKICLYGKSGTGKTTFWSTFPGPILALIIGASRRPTELKSIDTPENRKKINARLIGSLADFEGCWLELDDYSTVVIDHISALQDLVMQGVLGLDEMPLQKTFGMATQQDWGLCVSQTKEVLRRVLNSAGNTILVAQERTFDTGNESSKDNILPTIGPNVTPGLAAWLTPECGYVVQTGIRQKMKTRTITLGKGANKKTKTDTVKVEGEVEYYLRTGPNEFYITKFRKPKITTLPQFIVDPDFEKFDKVARGIEL